MPCSKAVSIRCALGALAALICTVVSSDVRADVVVHEYQAPITPINIIEINGYIKKGGTLVAAISSVQFLKADDSAHPSKQFLADGTVLDFGRDERIVRYQLILSTLTSAFTKNHFVVKKMPSDDYWLAIAIKGADLEDCWRIHHMRDKGIDIDVELKNETTGVTILTAHMGNWRASFSPNSKTYYEPAPTRRCTLHSDNNLHFKLKGDTTYTLVVTTRHAVPQISPTMYLILEGRGKSGEL
jgi:hypothetical protein